MPLLQLQVIKANPCYYYCALLLLLAAAMEKHRRTHSFRRFSSGHMRGRCTAGGHPFVAGNATAEREEEEEMIAKEAVPAYGLRENPRKSFRIVDPEFSSAAAVAAEPAGSSSAVVEDGESETESPWTASAPSHRCRSKRPLQHAAASSASDVTTEEDVARCLMMLSRSSWTGSGKEPPPSDGDEEGGGSRPSRRGRSRYCSSSCKKTLHSHRALGSHRATHQRPAVRGPIGQSPPSTGSAANANARVHECPFCFRAFASGQALGGHKRTHFIITSAPAGTWTTAKYSSGDGFPLIDLNMPAPAEDDTALSVVSYAELITDRAQ